MKSKLQLIADATALHNRMLREITKENVRHMDVIARENRKHAKSISKIMALRQPGP